MKIERRIFQPIFGDAPCIFGRIPDARSVSEIIGHFERKLGGILSVLPTLISRDLPHFPLQPRVPVVQLPPFHSFFLYGIYFYRKRKQSKDWQSRLCACELLQESAELIPLWISRFVPYVSESLLKSDPKRCFCEVSLVGCYQ
jgi:hypothetical protein